MILEIGQILLKMRSLCKGGNEPPGSLKANKLVSDAYYKQILKFVIFTMILSSLANIPLK